MNLPDDADKIIKQLVKHNYQAYAVGGCVRDSIMGTVPNDWDICTSATPEETIACFSGMFSVIPTGLKHGTVTVVVNKQPFEITTFRTESTYTDYRHPDKVNFVSKLSKDLQRRDFTINAMAFSDDSGLIDLYGGCNDISNRIIRCVGDPNKRFSEDALRILRALRFASVLGFDIEKDTKQAVINNKKLLQNIAPERLYAEFAKLLCGSNAESILMNYKEVIAEFIPQLSLMFGFNQCNPNHCYDVWQHTVKSVAAAPKNLVLRLTMLLHDCGKPAVFFTDDNGVGHFYGHPRVSVKIADSVLKFFHTDNKTTNTVLQLVEYHDTPIMPNEKSVKKYLNKIGKENFKLLLTVKRCDVFAQSPKTQLQKQAVINQTENIFNNIISQGYCMSVKDLNINGNDIISVGVPKGSQVGALLQKLLHSVQQGSLPNEKQALIAFAKKMAEKAEKNTENT